jgi:6-phosphogluconolactonase
LLLASVVVLSLVAGSADAALYERSHLYASTIYWGGTVQTFPIDPLGALGSHTSVPASDEATSVVISPDARALFVGSISSNTISSYVIGADGALSSRVATTPAHALDLAITPDGSFLYGVAGSTASGTFQGYAVNGSQLTELSPTSTLPAPMIATAVAVSPDGNSLYVGGADPSSSSDGSIYRYAIDALTGALSRPTQEAAGLAGVDNLGLSPDGTSLYAPAPGADIVYQFDVAPSSGALQPKNTPFFEADYQPYSVTITPNGRYAYVNSLGSVSGYAIDPDTGELTLVDSHSTQFLGRFGAVSPDGRNLYVAAYAIHQFSIDPTSGTLTPLGAPVPSDQTVHIGLAFTPDQNPVASFTATAAPAGSPSTFDATGSTDSDGTVSTYLWDFHDGPPVSGGPTITHTFASAGPHDVDLVVEDEMGCSTARTYTGHMVHCNGGSAAAQRQTVVIEAVEPPSPSPTPAPPNLVAGTPIVPQLPCVAGATPSNRFSISARAKRRSGTIVLSAKLPGCGRLELLGTHRRPRTAARAQLTPGNGRFAWGRRTVTTRREGSHTLVVAVKPNRRGRALIARHRSRGWPLHIRVSAAYRPDGGVTRRHVVLVRVPVPEVSPSGGR